MFASFRKNLGNECRISALVPLVEESYGIYEFITSMLRAMHAVTDDISVYEELRDKYNKQYYQLYKFYYDASALRYLTSLIAIPSLDPVRVFKCECCADCVFKGPAGAVRRECAASDSRSCPAGGSSGAAAGGRR